MEVEVRRIRIQKTPKTVYLTLRNTEKRVVEPYVERTQTVQSMESEFTKDRRFYNSDKKKKEQEKQDYLKRKIF